MGDPLARLVRGVHSAADLGSAWDGLRHRLGDGGRPAAVLALFAAGQPRQSQAAPDLLGLQVILMERAAQLRSHPGQISFPGGAAEEVDQDLGATALREAAEEVALRPESVEVLGALRPVHVPVSGFDVTTVVGRWLAPHPLRVADNNEVAAIYRVPVATLINPLHRATAVHASGYTSPAFVFDSDGVELFVWGLTAHLLDVLLQLGGWAVPWDDSVRLPVPQGRA